MQLFPTAFWRPGLTEKPVEGDSCYELVNVSVLNEDDNSYKLNVATTPDAEGLAGVGLYKDYSFHYLQNIKEGFPFAHLNRADGQKTRYTNSDGTIVDNIYDEFTNSGGVVYAPKEWISEDSSWKGWEDFWEETAGFSPSSIMLDHWLYVWMEQPNFYYGGATRDLLIIQIVFELRLSQNNKL